MTSILRLLHLHQLPDQCVASGVQVGLLAAAWDLGAISPVVR